MVSNFKILLILILLFFTYNSSYSYIYIIANESVDDIQLTKSNLIEIYTLNKLYWYNGEKIKVIDYKGETELKYTFYSYLEIGTREIQKIWLRKQFSGKAMPPATYKTENEIIRAVENTEGAIAYVSKLPKKSSVKILAKIDINIVKKDE